jgi:D-3-phosphoglycerate dehydrogenase
VKALLTSTGKYEPGDWAIELGVLESAGVEVATCPGESREEILEHGRDCAAFFTSAGVFDGPLFDQLSGCQVVVRYGIGVDTIDVPAATARGVIVSNVPDAWYEEVADHTMALVLGLLRHLTIGDAHVRGGGWGLAPLRPTPKIRGLTLGIVGLGHIGQALASRALPFGFRVIACDPYVSAQDASRMPVELVAFEDLLAQSDVVSVNAPLTDETVGLFGGEAFRRMKPGAYFVNTSRGKIHDERALYEALTTGQIAGAGLDVFEVEPPDAKSPLLEMDSVIVTPHCAGLSEGSLREGREKAGRNAVAVLKGYYPPYVVNRDVVPRRPLRPYPGNNRALLAE